MRREPQAHSKKSVDLFGDKNAEGRGSIKLLLGEKGADLAELSRIGLPVPPGFTITAEVCTYFLSNKQTYPEGQKAQIKTGVAIIEKLMNSEFGGMSAMPLLVSTRCGARASMPGIANSILNLGLNDQTVSALAKVTGNDRFAWSSYCRFTKRGSAT